jgi:tellurite resistance protein
MSLRKEGFVAIAAVARADGLLRKDELSGLLGAARDAGLSASDVSEVERALSDAVPLAEIDFSGLSGAERALTYSLAHWLASVDGIVNTQELATLRELAKKLDLPDLQLKAAAAAAFDIVCLPGGHRPEKFQFADLEARLREKLPALMSR